MKFQECQHVFSNGVTCQAPRVRNHRYCYFHVASRDRTRRQRIAAQNKVPLQLPVLEDSEVIQLALVDVVNAMLCDRIDTKKAALALYALQTASVNLKSDEYAKGRTYRDYSPELDASLPATENEPVVESTAAANSAPADATEDGIPPKKPVARAPKPKSILGVMLRHARRQERLEEKERLLEEGTSGSAADDAYD